jgi:diacylglycerol kinase family enzyme
VTEVVAKDFKLYSSHKKQLVSIDGEVSKMRPPLTFTLKPKHVRVLVPRQQAAS